MDPIQLKHLQYNFDQTIKVEYGKPPWPHETGIFYKITIDGKCDIHISNW